MKYILIQNKKILALDPAYRGMGYALIEDHVVRLLDWGTKSCKSNKTALFLKRTQELISHHHPDILVLEDVEGNSRRCKRVQTLIHKIVQLAAKKKIKVRTFSRVHIAATFVHAQAHNKHEIAQTICKFFPELAPRMPRYRVIWRSEDFRMNIFDAVALGMTYLHSRRENKRKAGIPYPSGDRLVS